jgi:hypothetical protein
VRIAFSCSVQGDAFRPTEAERRTGIQFSEKNEPGEIGKLGRHKGQPIPFGSGTIESETTGDAMNGSLSKFLDILKHCVFQWRELGAEVALLNIDVFYDEQCNLEISEENIAVLSELGLSLALSCYRDK